MTLKRWLVTVSASALLLGLWATPVLAQEDGGDQPKPKRAKAAKTPRAKQAKPARVGVGTPLAGALAKMELSDEQKTKAGDALKAWADKAKAERTEYMNKQKELRGQIKEAGQDKAKRDEINKQLKELKPPTEEAQYASAKAAVQGILSEEQLKQVDELTVTSQKELAGKMFDGQIAGLAKKGVELSDEQKTKVAAERTKMDEQLGGLKAGEGNKARSISMKAVWAVKKDVLTDEQKAKIAPAKRERTQGEGNKPRPNKQGRQKPKNNGQGGEQQPVGGEED